MSDGLDFVTTDPAWYGCEGDQRNGENYPEDEYEFDEVLGLLYRPDVFAPRDTVPIFEYYSTVSNVEGGWSPGEDQCLVSEATEAWNRQFFEMGSLGTLLTGSHEYERDGSVGWGYSPNYRPLVEEELVPIYMRLAAEPDDCQNVGAPGTEGETLVFYALSASAVDLTPAGSCEDDADCASTELCYWPVGGGWTPEGVAGTCTQRCTMDSHCGGEHSYCDLMSLRCAASAVDFDGSHARFARASVASYQASAERILWAATDVPRYEDIGDGFGPHLLIEEAGQNLVTATNDLGGTAWQRSNVVTYPSVNSPGGDGSTVLRRGPLSADAVASPTLAMPGGSPALYYSVSWWSRALLYSGGYQYEESVGGAAPASVERDPTPHWERGALSATFDPLTPGIVRFGLDVATPEDDARYLAYAQVEGRSFPTSVMSVNGSGASRAADVLEIDLSDSPSAAGFSWRFYVWPKFSCLDLRREGGVQELLAFQPSTGTAATVSFIAGAVDGCTLRFFDPGAMSPTWLFEGLEWSRDQLLIVEIAATSNPLFGEQTGVRVSGTSDGAVGGLRSGHFQWAADATLLVGRQFNGRVTPPVIPNASGSGLIGTIIRQRTTSAAESALFEFSTNTHCESDLLWGLDESVEDTVEGAEGTLHSIALTDLEPQTTYYYRVSLDCGLNEPDLQPLMSFTTAGL